MKEEIEKFKEKIKSWDNDILLTGIRKAAHFVDKGTANKNTKLGLKIMFHQAKLRKLVDEPTIKWAAEVYNRVCKHKAEKQADIKNRKKSFNSESFLDIIRSRRSIRQFEETKLIPKRLLEKLIDAGRWAPSSCNRQPQKFLVLLSREGKRFMADMRGKGHSFIIKASVLILVLIDLRVYSKDEISYTPFLDGAATIQNILLMAHALCLGANWVNLGKEECSVDKLKMIKKKFNIPPYFLIVSLIAIGLPSKSVRTVERKQIKDLVVFECF